MANLRRLDLNLPVTFDALLAEHNVTRAAERLHLSQPSVSVHLGKLREALGDRLLLPGPRGMRPTARAEQLREPPRAALEGLRQVVAPVAGFVPAEAAQRWRIATTDYGTAAILLPAMAALRKQAPGTRLAELEMVPARIAVQAERGGIDLALHASDDALPGCIAVRCSPRSTCWSGATGIRSCAGGRRCGSSACSSMYRCRRMAAASPVRSTGSWPSWTWRKVVLSVPHFRTALAMVARTDLVAMVPQRLLQEAAGLRIVAPPLQVPGFEMSMPWHERIRRDPGHRWLRELIAVSLRTGAGAG